MKRAGHKTQQIQRILGILAAIILPLVTAGLLITAVSGCTGNETAVAESPPISETVPATSMAPQSTATSTATAPALAELPTSTIPAAIPTLTTLPTSSPTLPPAATETATVTATAEVLAEAATELPLPTKPPPLPTPSGIYSWTLQVPILMYHYISEPPEDADKYRVDLSVAPQDFEAQMSYLAENGYETVDLYDLSLAIAAKRELPPKPVIITLDDGYVDNYENAFPILQAHDMEATFFVVTQFIDEGREGYLDWDMVEEMAAAGMRIEPHSKTHPDLSEAEREYVVYEALGSQETIAAHIGYTPRYFCYPGGDYNEETMSIIEELDFWGAVTTAGGKWHGFDDRFEWSRVRMRNTTALLEFADMVNSAGTVSGKPAP
jgi:peptidoglycan/xylan/chitin deacetylase (PgdA/CDA1 family)